MDSINSKTVAIISHITLLGWIIALIINSSNKTEFGSFYIRQTLILNLVLSLGLTSFIGRIIAILGLILLVISLLGAFTGEKKLVPGVGDYFQDWFKSI
ncbi:MAG: hypothetical protein ACPGVD_00465 [Flavobacteriales bacterium]